MWLEVFSQWVHIGGKLVDGRFNTYKVSVLVRVLHLATKQSCLGSAAFLTQLRRGL